MRPNRYAGSCIECGGHVRAKAGTIKRDELGIWRPVHLACNKAGAAAVSVIYFPGSGKEITRNSRGICEDAPCCGCCTF